MYIFDAAIIMNLWFYRYHNLLYEICSYEAGTQNIDFNITCSTDN